MINNKNTFEILMMLKEVYSKSMHKIECELSDSGLTHQQIMVIKILAHSGEINISELCNKMSLTKGTVSGIINRLEKMGYVEKIKYDSDKRNTYVVFSVLGKEFAREIKEKMNETFNGIFKSLSEEEYKKVKEGLSILREKL